MLIFTVILRNNILNAYCIFLDIVFCRTWYRVDVPEFYNPVNTLLLPPDKKNAWKGVRTTGEIKREEGVKNPANKDSLYTVIFLPQIVKISNKIL